MSVFERAIGRQFFSSECAPFLYRRTVIILPESGMILEQEIMPLYISIRIFMSCLRFFLKNSYVMPSGPGDLLFGSFLITATISLDVIGATRDDNSSRKRPAGSASGNSGGHILSEE